MNSDKKHCSRVAARLIAFSLIFAAFTAPAHADGGKEKKMRTAPPGVVTGSNGGGLKELGDPLNGAEEEKKRDEQRRKEEAENFSSRSGGGERFDTFPPPTADEILERKKRN